jgi:hypothetical protein
MNAATPPSAGVPKRVGVIGGKVARGELGRKTGQGFHTWEESR